MSILRSVHSGDSYSPVVYMLCLSVEGWLILLVDTFELADLSLDLEVCPLGLLMLEDLSLERGNFPLMFLFIQLVVSSTSQGGLDFFEDDKHFFESVSDRTLLSLNLIGFKLDEVTGGFRDHLVKNVVILTSN